MSSCNEIEKPLVGSSVVEEPYGISLFLLLPDWQTHSARHNGSLIRGFIYISQRVAAWLRQLCLTFICFSMGIKKLLQPRKMSSMACLFLVLRAVLATVQAFVPTFSRSSALRSSTIVMDGKVIISCLFLSVISLTCSSQFFLFFPSFLYFISICLIILFYDMCILWDVFFFSSVSNFPFTSLLLTTLFCKILNCTSNIDQLFCIVSVGNQPSCCYRCYLIIHGKIAK